MSEAAPSGDDRFFIGYTERGTAVSGRIVPPGTNRELCDFCDWDEDHIESRNAALVRRARAATGKGGRT